jgi:DNA-binding CsgD family transcriptional regulator
VRLSECLPKTVLRSDEWYNDFVVRCGVRDILGVRLFENSSHAAILGIYYGLYQTRSGSADAARLKELLDPLSQAARLHVELRNMGWKSSIALRALDQLANGVLVTDGDGRIIELNRVAEHILCRDDGLAVRNGKLCALRVFEDNKLMAFISAAAVGKTAAATGRMLIGRRGGQKHYAVTVASIGGAQLGVFERPLALILIGAPEHLAPSERDVAEIFGLSPAESRLAVALIAGKKLADIAANSGVRITTLRTQLSSILRKVGATRQADLIRILSSVPVVPASIPYKE